MALDLLTSRQLYKVLTDDRLAVAPTYALDNFFSGGAFYSTAEEIAFEKLPTSRAIAPFVLPTEQGRPIYSRLGSRLDAFKPAYIKPKDSLRATDNFVRTPGELIPGGVTGSFLTPQQRRSAEIIRIMNFHKNAITRTWDYMAWKALLDGYLDINYASEQGLPNVRVDFGRDAANTMILGTGAQWGDSGVSIKDFVTKVIAQMNAAAFGGTPTRMYLGAQASIPFMAAVNSGELKDLMDTRYRGATDVNLNRGIVVQGDPATPAVSIGYLMTNLEVFLFSGTFYDQNTGTMVPIMDPRDVLFTAPGIDGLKCFGAIADDDANLAPIDIFPKMWRQDDPSATFIMNQSAPLMIPVNPNCTLRARVVA